AATATAGRGGGRGQTTTTPTPTTANLLATLAGQTPAERARGPEDRPQTTSWLIAADELQAGDSRIATVRGAGFASAATFPTRGIFGGQGSLIDLASGEKSGEMVLIPSVGQYIALGSRGFGGGGGGGFPSSLMGVISYIRQIYLDAAHYQLVKDAYA